MLELKNISHSVNEKLLFERVSFSVYESQKVGLVGPNGAGKTTLLELVSGAQNIYKGQIYKPNEFNVYYLDIEALFLKSPTVCDLVYPEWKKADTNLNNCLKDLGKSTATKSLLSKYNTAYEEFEKLGGYSVEYVLDKYLGSLELSHLSMESIVENLSGGEKMKLSLVPILRQEFDLVMLDEPTNNLDRKSINWLAEFIVARDESFIIISHDRAFLDAVCDKTLILDAVTKSITSYSGNYTFAIERNKVEKEKLKLHYEVQKRLIKRLNADIRATKEQALKTENATTNDYIRGRSKKVALKAKARECRLNKVVETKKLDKPKESKKVKFDIKEVVNRSSLVAKAENLAIGFLDNELISEINLELNFGERVVITGDNACGKTTLVRTLLGKIEPMSGSFYFNHNMEIGLLTQERLLSKLNMKVIDAFQLHNFDSKRLPESKIRKQLNDIKLFSNCLDKTLGELSLGERTKLELAFALSNEPDLLIMDEPTNHLDIDAIEALEYSLSSYRGTLLVISHDGDFINKIGFDWTWSIDKNRLVQH